MEKHIPAYAKVNLHLEVLNRRADGYHEIRSIMASVGLCDLLKLEDIRVREGTDTPVAVRIINAGGRESALLDSIPADDNLIARATKSYLGTLGMTGTVVYSLEKNIPAGAGMGGGSTDAAAALKLLNAELSGLGAPDLAALGASLGADIPFCLQGGMAWCSGIGDIVEPLASRLPHSIIIVNDGIHVNTGQAYRSLNRDLVGPPSEVLRQRRERISTLLASGDLSSAPGTLVNDFEGPVFSEHPRLQSIKEAVYHQGAQYAAMTGSGSTVFGLFSDEHRAQTAAAVLSTVYRLVLVTRFIA